MPIPGYPYGGGDHGGADRREGKCELLPGDAVDDLCAPQRADAESGELPDVEEADYSSPPVRRVEIRGDGVGGGPHERCREAQKSGRSKECVAVVDDRHDRHGREHEQESREQAELPLDSVGNGAGRRLEQKPSRTVGCEEITGPGGPYGESTRHVVLEGREEDYPEGHLREKDRGAERQRIARVEAAGADGRGSHAASCDIGLFCVPPDVACYPAFNASIASSACVAWDSKSVGST